MQPNNIHCLVPESVIIKIRGIDCAATRRTGAHRKTLPQTRQPSPRTSEFRVPACACFYANLKKSWLDIAAQRYPVSLAL